MATLTRPPRDPFRSPLAEALRAAPRRPAPAEAPPAELGLPVLRAACVLAAGAYALDRWMALLEHPPAGVLFRAVAVCALAAAALLAASRTPSRRRRALAAAGTLLAALVALLAVAGVPGHALVPRGWGTLTGGLGDGLSALPGLTVPYRGSQEWARTILTLGGCLLLLAAVVGATWPRRPAPGSRMTAVAALGVLYAVPATELTDGHAFRAGAFFAVALAAVLYAERLRPRQVPWAVATFLAAIGLGSAFAPRLDAGRPLVDVQELASQLQGSAGLRFTWEHRYGPLTWPREGRIVLRVRAKVGAYWKAETLEDFDGLRWTVGEAGDSDQALRRAWVSTIHVTVQGMRGAQFIGAGSTTYINHSRQHPVAGTGGSWVSDSGALEQGDSYRAVVYYPRPSAHDLVTAGTDYPSDVVDRDLTILVPVEGYIRPAEVRFPAWGLDGVPQSRHRAGIFGPEGARYLKSSPYTRAYALARRLRARARTPYGYVTAVQRFLSRGFTYDESPPRRAVPLASFLFTDHRGYCQQFSGAMALLLRLGGVPARVATGFSPGTTDARSGEYIVRDLDAHSWVEAYFPRIGWVTFDPTPQIAPAASQLGLALAGVANPSGDRPGPTGRNASRTGGSTGGGSGEAAAPAWWRAPLVLGVVVLALLATLVLAAVLRLERGRHPETAPELAELERALRRAGRDPRPPTTLRDLARLLGPDERASGYLNAVSDVRYGTGPGPTIHQRSALRRALGDGLGVRGRLRALWALPPRPRRRRRELP